MLANAGVCWRTQVIGQKRPETGSEMHNTALAAALEQGTRWFSKEELEALKVGEDEGRARGFDHTFIKARGVYFKPSASAYEPATVRVDVLGRQVLTYARLRRLTYAHVCSRMLTYAHVCRMLTYACRW